MVQQRGEPEEFFDEATAPQASQEVAGWRQDPAYQPPFEVVRWRVVDEQWEGRSAIDAVVVVEINGREDIEAAQGVSGVQALDSALRRVLLRHFPFLEGMQLMELYTHRGGQGTATEVVSIMKFSDDQQQWSTSCDLLASAWMALLDGYEWAITKTLDKESNES
jgi:2-isopropylmalate synthase